MKKEKVIAGSDNVFEDLGFPDPQEHQAKARLVGHIAEIMKERKLTQSAAAKLIGLDQPKVSALLSGRFRGFSIYRLMSFIAALGRDIEIVLSDGPPPRSRHEQTGHIFVR